jgi:hypothetical protein
MPDYQTPAYTPAARGELERAVKRLYDRARIVLGKQCEATVNGVVDWYIQELTCAARDESIAKLIRRGQYAAVEVALHVIDCPDFAWWGTALGRAVAWHIGYTKQEVPREVVAAVLGISRQRVHVLVQRDGAFTPERLRDRLREQWGAMQLTAPSTVS